MRSRWMWIVPAAVAGIVFFVFLGGQAVRLLWNWLAPALFGWPTITFWQAVGLLALCRILFGGFGGHGRGPRGQRGFNPRLADRVADRWAQMTPEERERFRQRMRERCGFDPADTGPSTAAP